MLLFPKACKTWIPPCAGMMRGKSNLLAQASIIRAGGDPDGTTFIPAIAVIVRKKPYTTLLANQLKMVRN